MTKCASMHHKLSGVVETHLGAGSRGRLRPHERIARSIVVDNREQQQHVGVDETLRKKGVVSSGDLASRSRLAPLESHRRDSANLREAGSVQQHGVPVGACGRPFVAFCIELATICAPRRT